MDRFGRQPSSSGQYGSQIPQTSQAHQQRAQTSQPGPGPAYPQPQGSQSSGAYASGNPSQGAQSFARSQTVQPGLSQNQGQNVPSSSSMQSGPNHAMRDNRPTGGQGPQTLAAPKLSEQRPPSISRRQYIKWSMIGKEQAEDTETLVLTDPASKLFVDVRLLNRTLKDARPGNPVMLEPEDIDWAFAGTINNTALGPENAPYHRKVVFNHWIDSRSLHPEEIEDKAFMYSPNDGTNDEIEVGSMVNPHTGDKQGYEERWSDEEVLPAKSADGRQCIAMTTEQPDGTRGCVMVLGQWAQGVMRTGQGTLHIERWYSEPASRPASSQQGQGNSNPTGLVSPGPSHAGLFSPPPQIAGLFSPAPSHAELPDKSEGWSLIARVGVPILPSPSSFVAKNLTEGTICSVSGMNWTVRAVRKW